MQGMNKEEEYTYTVLFEPAEEGGYVVTVPALPGCVTQGDTLEEAREMATDAILGYLEEGEGMSRCAAKRPLNLNLNSSQVNLKAPPHPPRCARLRETLSPKGGEVKTSKSVNRIRTFDRLEPNPLYQKLLAIRIATWSSTARRSRNETHDFRVGAVCPAIARSVNQEARPSQG